MSGLHIKSNGILVLILLVCGQILCGQNAYAAGPQVTPVPGLRIRASAALRPGSYRCIDPGGGIIQVSGQNVTLECRGARLVGPGTRRGIGLHIVDARNVTIRNADLTGWQWGVVIERSVGVTLVDCTVSGNADLPPGTVIDESGQGPEDDHGGGIVIRDCRDCHVLRCTAQHQWDGIDVVRSRGCIIEDGDYSYNGNWGLHLWDSSQNVFRHNRAIWCTTGAGTLYQALTGWQTYDAQAVGIDHNSNENRIEGNDLRFGGDGIFIRANEGPIAPGTVVPPRNGSHRNQLIDNDCSFSPNNAIEVDLVDDTIIRGNNCSFSHYGMWLGYSRRCVVTGNTCINDTAYAVEIENGQDDTFANNVFGYDTARPGSQLVYLRQNGRDTTPSGPYEFAGNLFYGAQGGLRLKATTARLRHNSLRWTGEGAPKLVTSEDGARFADDGTSIERDDQNLSQPNAPAPLAIEPGKPVRLRGISLYPNLVPVVELDGIPVWVRSRANEEVVFSMPYDFWDRPHPRRATVRVLGAGGWTTCVAALHWPPATPRIESITPNPARVGDMVTITGVDLAQPVTFNGQPATVIEASRTRMAVRLPDGIITGGGYNVQCGSARQGTQRTVGPVTFHVDVPREQMPHLLNAAFSPQTLHVGELLTVTFTVKNNLPTPVALMTQPQAPFTYDESQAWSDVGVREAPHTLQLRVTSDRPAGHDPGSWPWLFGFGMPQLAAGETVTVTGHIRVRTPGVHEFRVGLVATGGRFIDDNAFRTRITVER